MSLPAFPFSPDPIEHEVLGQRVKFWPVSYSTFLYLKNVATPIIQSILTLINGDSKLDKDYVSETRTVGGPGDGEEVVQRFSAIKADLAAVRHEQRNKAVQTLTEAIFSEKEGWIFVALCVDCAREVEWPVKDTVVKIAKHVAVSREMTVDVLIEMLVGVAKANKRFLDPLGMSALVDVAGKLAQRAKDPPALT
jgi:hypothetical protein